VRSQHPAFGRGSLTLLPVTNPSILVYLRQHHDEMLLILNNLSPNIQQFTLPMPDVRQEQLIELFHSDPSNEPRLSHGGFALEPYGFVWYHIIQ
jgi:maltose alpha-D-glucosyltransferase/alpha-amylase